jgi:hypothetical protein
MPRTARVASAAYVFHVLNRGNERRTIFEADRDYLTFFRLMGEKKACLSTEPFGRGSEQACGGN